MSRPPVPVEELIERYGPHLNYTPAGGWVGEPPDRLVKTHCCFCGQQCGIQLKVRGNQVVGFEPWEEFPFNRGMLCPKGVKRYLQNEHPDRLKHPLVRTDSGFRPATWDEALDLTVLRLREIQDVYGKDAVARMVTTFLRMPMPERFDASDALAVALCHLNQCKGPPRPAPTTARRRKDAFAALADRLTPAYQRFGTNG